MGAITIRKPENIPAFDTKLAELSRQQDALDRQIQSYQQMLHSIAGDRFNGREWNLTLEEVFQKLERYDTVAYTAKEVDDSIRSYNDLIRQRVSLDIDVAERQEVYYEHRWSRFFLVNNVGGHIHSSTGCSTCRYDTSFSWLPELSGLTEADAVEAYGSILCSVCFPSAPVEWTNGVSKAVAAEREAKAAAKAEREAKREAKRLVPGSDEGIVVEERATYKERVTTVAAAKTFLTDGYLWGWNHPSFSTAARDAVAAALLGRPGVKETSVEEILAAAKKRAAKRR